MKNPLTLAGIEPATFRFVAQRLNDWSPVVLCTNVKRLPPPLLLVLETEILSFSALVYDRSEGSFML